MQFEWKWNDLLARILLLLIIWVHCQAVPVSDLVRRDVVVVVVELRITLVYNDQ